MKKLLFIFLVGMNFISSCSSAEENNDDPKSTNDDLESYDGIRPITSCNTNYYIVGQDLEVDVFFNRKINHELKVTFYNEFDAEIEMVEGKDYTINEESIHLSKENLSVPGGFVIKAKISIVDGDKELKIMDFKYEYSVGMPTAVVTTEHANELVQNEESSLNVAVAGYTSEDYKLTTNNGEIFNDDGKWIIRPEHQGHCVVKIVLTSNEEIEIGEYPFQVKVK